MLGWERIEAIDGETKDFYIRQLWDAKGSAEIERMNPAGLERIWSDLRLTLARAHARSGDAERSPRISVREIVRPGDGLFSETYADQNERDTRPCRTPRRVVALSFSTDSTAGHSPVPHLTIRCRAPDRRSSSRP